MTTTQTTQRAAGLRSLLGGAIVLAAATFLGTATVLEAQIPAPPQNRPIALVGGTIHPVSGPAIPNGTILFEDGVITAVGTNVEIPAGAQRVDVSGQHVYPGLIDSYSAVGLFEIGGFDVTIDLNELGPINPNVEAQVAFNPESRHIGTTRSNGVLTAVSTPSGGLIAGMQAAMALDGWSWDRMTLRPRVGLMVNWPNPGNASQYREGIRLLRDTFAEARAYGGLVAGATTRFDTDPRLEAMLPVLAGEVPVVVNANDTRQMQDAITWAEEEGVRLILLGGRDAAYIADHLARKEVPVLLTSVIGAPARAWEGYDGAYAAPARLFEAGVTFGITGGSSAPYANRLPYEAGSAIAYGLPEDEAVRSVTLYPARILGIDDRVGSLEPGKDATLLITSGNPLDYLTRIDQAYIQGRAIDMVDAHRAFYEKYSEKGRQMPPSGDR